MLEPLCDQDGVTSPPLRSAVARIYLQGGYVQLAAKHFAAVAADPTTQQSVKDMNEAILASADGDWERTGKVLREILATDPDNFVVSILRLGTHAN